MTRDPGVPNGAVPSQLPAAAAEVGRLEVFLPADGGIDLRALLGSRGESIEAGLSVIDGDLPIAGLGVVDLVAIDTQRRLVVVDLAGRDEGGLDGRPLAHARWFRDNLPIVRRMYQLWNVRWDVPTRAIWVSAEPASGGADERIQRAEDEVRVERISARLARTREGREALFLMPAVGAVPEIPRPAARLPAAQTDSRPAAAEEFGAVRDAIPPRAEAYRRELGLSSDEFAEFFARPGSPPEIRQGGGGRDGRIP